MAFEGDIQNYAPAEVDEVGQIILKARELLSDPAKWFKGEYVCEETGAVCILGAMGWRESEDFDGEQRRVADAAEHEIQRFFPFVPEWDGHRPSIPQFNDDPNTTHADVLALLDRAASTSPKA